MLLLATVLEGNVRQLNCEALLTSYGYELKGTLGSSPRVALFHPLPASKCLSWARLGAYDL